MASISFRLRWRDQDGFDHLEEVGAPIGFHQRPPPRRAARPYAGDERKSGRVNDLDLWTEFLGVACQRETVEPAGQNDVGDEQPEWQALLEENDGDVGVD